MNVLIWKFPPSLLVSVSKQKENKKNNVEILNKVKTFYKSPGFNIKEELPLIKVQRKTSTQWHLVNLMMAKVKMMMTIWNNHT